MRNILPKLLVLAATALPLAAHADSIDNFILTDIAGGTIAFSLPASPPIFGPSSPFLFETFPVSLSFDPTFFGNKSLDGQILFYSALGGGGLNVLISHPGGITPIIDHGDLLYTGTTADPTFLTGTFHVGTDTLTITPQTGPVPEPSALVLLATGTLGVLCLTRRRRQVA
jgi:PEP-CTERM motif